MNKSLRKNSTQRISFPKTFYKGRIDENSKGFTLVELMVVLATIAVLAVTLIPTFASVRPNSLAFQCMNNLRQWGAAMRTAASDNNDMIARDGTDNGGQYSVDSGKTGIPTTLPLDQLSGTPNDPYAWFNTLPQLVASQPLSYYYALTGLPYKQKYPFPNNDVGKIWMCPSAQVAANDVFAMGTAGAGGKFGFFCYAMNIDLKDTTPISASYQKLSYPLMPKFDAIRNPSVLVLLADTAFSPGLESYLATPSTNGAPSDSGADRAEKKNPDIWWNPNR